MATHYAEISMHGKYGVFGYENLKISFLMEDMIWIRHVISWNNGILTVKGRAKAGETEQEINIAAYLSDLGYDADKIVASIDRVNSKDFATLPEKYYAMCRRGDNRYQVSCRYGSVLFDEKGELIACSMPEEMVDGAKEFFSKELEEFEERKNETRLDVRWTDRMPDFSSKYYAFFADGDVYYSVMKVFPEGWSIQTKNGRTPATELSHSETYGAEADFTRCMLLSGFPLQDDITETEREIFELSRKAIWVRFGIAFYKEDSYLRAVPLGWRHEYAIFDKNGDVIESTMEGNRLDRAKAVYIKYDCIFTGK